MLAYQVPAFVDFGRVYLPAYDVEPDYLAQQRRRRRQIALAQAEAAERHRREKEQELAYRLALAQDFERRRRRDEFAREQRRREEEQRRRIAHARRQRQLGPHALFDFLVQIQPELLDTLASRNEDEERDDSAFDVDEYVTVPLRPAQVSSTLVADPEELDLAAAVASAADDDTSDADDASDRDDSSTMQADSESDASADEIDTSAERDASLAALASLANDLDSHRASFVSPTTLTFSASPSPADRSTRSPTPPLAFGHSNTPFLAYEEYLLSLLTKLDAIESHGDSTIKRARKELVKQIEAELARLDDLKEKAWEELSASASSSSSNDEADDESMSSESDDDEEDEEMAGPAEVLTLSSDCESASDSSSSPEPELAPQTVKIPFLPQNSRSSLRRRPSRSRDWQSEDRDGFFPSSPTNHADDEVADVLLRAHKLGAHVAEMEEAERERADMDEMLSEGEEDESDSSDEEGMFVLYL